MKRPYFSVISAVHNVARYLPDFIASIERQTFDLTSVQVVMVDDGSTDESLTLLKDWQAQRPELVTVLSQANAGQGAARNAGLEAATGEWVTFPDPDDLLEPDYFERVAAVLAKYPESTMAAVKILNLWEADSRIADDHPLTSKFRGGDQLVDLKRFPEYIQLSAATAFFRTEGVADLALRFDDAIRPNFEDAHFIGRYLLAQPRPLLTVVGSTHYLYRRRGDATSTLQQASGDYRRYTDVLRLGYLDLMERARALHGQIPHWLQNVVLYDTSWLLRAEERITSTPNAATLGVADEYHDLMSRIVRHLDRSVVDQYRITRLPIVLRNAYKHGWRDDSWVQDWAHVDHLDSQRELVRVRYLYTGAAPTEEAMFRGAATTPVHAKVRDVNFAGRAVLRERILWMRADGTLRLRLNGQDVPLRYVAPPVGDYVLRPAAMHRALEHKRATESQGNRPSPADRFRWPARREWKAARFANAWVFVDRTTNANDNAEHLFRHVRASRPDINAWFVLRKDSSDWPRLRREFGRRVVAFGSQRWIDLCLQAEHLVSSHADRHIVAPVELRPFGGARWRFTFLQHGVTKDDISRWLNDKPIATFATATADEFASIAGDGSPYTFTTKEVVRTGFPRHDRLVGLQRTADGHRLVVVMPTWRRYLASEVNSSGVQMSASSSRTTPFVVQWLELLGSTDLRRAVQAADARLVLFAHPNLRDLFAELDLPEHIEVRNYTDDDVQQALTDAAVVVTDYSSVIFDAAVIERPIVYFQFDPAEVFAGGHLTRPGYFSYERDGFGPVAGTADNAVEAIAAALATGGVPAEPYLSRMQSAFDGVRDGKSCTRVLAAIESTSRRQVQAPPAPPIEIPVFALPAPPDRTNQAAPQFAEWKGTQQN